MAGVESAAEYEEVSVDPGHAILPDLRFSRDQSHLYVVTEAKVSSIYLGRKGNVGKLVS